MSISETQKLETIEVEALLQRVEDLRGQGHRLVQIGATRLPEVLELTYSFDLNHSLQSLRLQVPVSGARMASISQIFWCAFLYENEIHDLFGVQFEGLLVDFHGKLYQTALKFPFVAGKRPSATLQASSATAGKNITNDKPEQHQEPLPSLSR